MEFLYIVLLGAIIYLLINNKNRYDSKMENLEIQILELQRLLKQNLTNRPSADNTIMRNEQKVQLAKPLTPPSTEQKEPLAAPKTSIPQYKEVVAESPAPLKQVIKPSIKPPVFKVPESRQSFFERYPDLEKFIGENLINKIGIAILVLAIGFFVKYAIDNDWVGPIGRVGIGILCGTILIGIAHRLRNDYKAFSSVLVGGGLAIFYFTITLAYHQFHLFNQTQSFCILVVITLFAVVLSLLYNKQELAVIALVGGLASPFMVSSDHANYTALFIYLITLNAGLLAIAYFKLWRFLNISAFALTIIICAGVVFSIPKNDYIHGFWYLSILYLLFFATNIANNIKENKAFISSDFSILLINTALYFSAGLYLLTLMQMEALRGVFTASLAIVNLVLSFVLFKVRKVDANILYLLIGITLTFISLAAPIQLHGHYITMFWAAETVLIYWLYLKSGIKLMKLTSLIIWGAMTISLFIDWVHLYHSSAIALNIIANKGFITTLMAAFSSFAVYALTEKDESEAIYGVKIKGYIFQYAALALLFLSGYLEVNHQFLNRCPHTSLNILYLMVYIPAFIYCFHIAVKKAAIQGLNPTTSTLLIALAITIYLAASPEIYQVQYYILVSGSVHSLHFVAHWAGAIIIGLLFYQLIRMAIQQLNSYQNKIAAWIIAGAIVLFLSLEASIASNALFYSGQHSLDRITTVYIKTGLPVLWGLASFTLMWLGMHHKVRTLRIISLSLFSLTLIKLFLFDIRNIPPAGKIAAFFCLGVLLLIVSFMYQKVKKIIVHDEFTPENKD